MKKNALLMGNVVETPDFVHAMMDILVPDFTGFFKVFILLLGDACECVPGCHAIPPASRCSNRGNCDCINGGCVCNTGFLGVNCEIEGTISRETLLEDQEVFDDIAEKVFFKLFGNII